VACPHAINLSFVETEFREPTPPDKALASATFASYKLSMPGQKKSIRAKRATIKPPTDAIRQRKRLPPEVRRTHILDAAARLIVDQGFLPLPIERLARAADTSKALIYTYFPTQYDIFNSLLLRELTALKIAGLETASSVKDLEQSVLLSAMLYFEHVMQSGPLLHILTTDLFMSERITDELVQAGEALLDRFTNTAQATLSLSKKVILAAIEMIAVIPQSAGSLVFHNELDAAVARQICHTLVLSCLNTLRTTNGSP
jgi:AcrR family transcriptional regulator